MIDIAKIRNDFPMLAKSGDRHFAYLDTASSSQTPMPVLGAMNDYYHNFRANVHRGMYKASEVATEKFEQVRRKIADMIGGSEDEIIFTRGTTESLNMVAYGLSAKLGPGDEVVTTVMEHHANLVPWQQLAKRYGFTLKFIPIKANYELDMDAARSMIGPKTRVLTMTYVSNVLGTIVPVADLAALARKHGATIVVDAAQAMGHIKVDVKKLDCDFLAFSGHKMLGPTGTGVLWGKKDRLEALPPFLFGGDMIRDVTFDDSTWNDVPYKFEAGTPDIAGVIGLGAAVDYITDIGLTSMAEQEDRLAKLAIARIMAIPGASIIGPAADGQRVGVVSFEVAGIHPHDMATILDAEGVAVRGGHHCAMPLLKSLGKMSGTTRASFAFYNSEDDVDALIRSIEKARKIMRVS